METVYIGYENAFRKQLTEDGSPIKLFPITKVAVQLHGTLYDSDTHPDAFDFTSEAATGHIVFKLGLIDTLLISGRDKKAELIVFAPDYPNGYVWCLLDIKTIIIE